MADTQARLLLRVSVKLLSLFGLGFAAYALLTSIPFGSDVPRASQTLSYRLNGLAENETQRIPWSGGNLILVRRSAATLAALQENPGALLDPASSNAHQPEGLSGPVRSHRPELFLAFDRGTDLGCPLGWIPPGNRDAPQQPWHGGFRDTCAGSWYDAAGRVFRNQQAERNLDIPPYRFGGGDLLEIGLNGDNAAPAK